MTCSSASGIVLMGSKAAATKSIKTFDGVRPAWVLASLPPPPPPSKFPGHPGGGGGDALDHIGTVHSSLMQADFDGNLIKVKLDNAA
jgi:hypothetical protein